MDELGNGGDGRAREVGSKKKKEGWKQKARKEGGGVGERVWSVGGVRERETEKEECMKCVY